MIEAFDNGGGGDSGGSFTLPRQVVDPSFGPSGKLMSDLIGYGSIAIVLVAAATKNNTDAIAGSEWWSAYTDAPIISAIKSFYPLILVAAAALLLAGAARAAVRLPRFRLATNLLTALYLYIFVRALVPAPDLALKYVLTIFVSLGIALNLGFSWISETIEESCEKVFLAVLISSLWIVATNFYNVLTGNGSVPGQARLIGVAGHPNFTGVQLALGVPFLLMGAFGPGRLKALVCFAALPVSLYLLLLTGSRTALVVLFVAVSVTVYVKLRMRFIHAFILGLASLPLFLLVIYIASAMGYLSLGQDNAFYRGENTRAETLAFLLNAVAERPFFGLGYFEGLPENSLLRGWAAFGIVLPVLLFCIFFVSLNNYKKIIRRTDNSKAAAALVGSYYGVLTGSALEGYLVDAYSYSMLIFLLLTLFSDRVVSVRRKGIVYNAPR